MHPPGERASSLWLLDHSNYTLPGVRKHVLQTGFGKDKKRWHAPPKEFKFLKSLAENWIAYAQIVRQRSESKCLEIEALRCLAV